MFSFQSSRELLKTGQPGSGIDLAGFLLEVYEIKGEAVTDESRGAWRKTLIDKSIAYGWSAKHGPCPAGDQALHHYVGELLYKEGSFEAAEPHFLASGSRDSARLLAEMFIQWATPTSTFGPFALRGTIPNALPSPIGTSSDEIVIAQDPIINFAQLAVATCQRAQGDRNKVMRESWVAFAALQDIATLSQAGNPMADMMSSLFGGPTSGQPTRRVLAPATGAIGLD
ncbi:hypothetical protein BT96DRAFT_927188 [Gymnopus androsaceus JB14]|uniref:Uncharacterized protein n=1 Tax=Gymnopus androsaceus JB14 TaxID=1447944 RepID=A0A6A4GS76_9AGAR|nr:hypothetical protein BT96DRAFT_927188 [Gymnopus androsaceus JB14]